MAGVNAIGDLLAFFGWYVIPFIIILSLIVSIHELGHYLVGRWCGVKIDAFSLGFGPELFARVDSRGTRWRVGALPLGGYVKFHGDANPASVGDRSADPSVDRSLTLPGQPLRNRAAIVLAGPVANFILAFVIFAGMFMAFGRVEHTPRIGRVEASSPAAAAGFQAGDLVKSIDGNPIDSFEALQESTLMSTGLPMHFVVERHGRDVDLTATPRISVVDQGVFGKRRMGHLGLASSADRKDAKVESLVDPVVKYVTDNQGCSQDALEKGVGGRREDVRKARDVAIERGRLSVVQVGNRKTHYAFSPTRPDSPGASE